MQGSRSSDQGENSPYVRNHDRGITTHGLGAVECVAAGDPITMD